MGYDSFLIYILEKKEAGGGIRTHKQTVGWSSWSLIFQVPYPLGQPARYESWAISNAVQISVLQSLKKHYRCKNLKK